MPNTEVKGHLGQKLLSGHTHACTHTHRTDCSTWTIKTVSKHLLWRRFSCFGSAHVAIVKVRLWNLNQGCIAVVTFWVWLQWGSGGSLNWGLRPQETQGLSDRKKNRPTEQNSPNGKSTWTVWIAITLTEIAGFYLLTLLTSQYNRLSSPRRPDSSDFWVLTGPFFGFLFFFSFLSF